MDRPLAASKRGLRALWVSFGVLALTAVFQAVIVAFTGSAALLGDTLHNFSDALTAVPLAVAFVLGRRAATARFTHGFGRAEDLAGLVILVFIAVSAASAGWFALRRLADPQDIEHLWWLAAAGAVGFAGNEWVARYRIRVGREIGSAALVADGLHARTDGLTSLAVLGSAASSALGWQLGDPVIGLGITAAIVLVLVVSSREVFGRILDGVDPADVALARAALLAVPGVHGVDDLRLRWVGHDLQAQAELSVDADITFAGAHQIAHEAEHRLMHDLPRLAGAAVHVHPAGPEATRIHAQLSHHRGDGTPDDPPPDDPPPSS